MTPDEFAHAVRLLCQQFGGSVTSWGRTVKHSRAVGGFASDPHTWWLGADVIWDTVPLLANDLAPGTFNRAIWDAGVTVIREKDHDHLQPIGWTNRAHPARDTAPIDSETVSVTSSVQAYLPH